jgi:hypothetical protein
MTSTAAERTDSIQIQLREPKWVDRAALVFSALMMLSGLIYFMSGAGFNALIGFFIMWIGYSRLHLGSCELELSNRGILLRCYSLGPFSSGIRRFYCIGVIPWANLAEVGVTKVQMTRCLGFRFTDLRAFLNSRNQLTDEQTSKSLALNKVSVGSPKRFATNILGGLFGYTGSPILTTKLGGWNGTFRTTAII